MELLYDVKDGLATLTLNRPEKLNAVTDAMRQGLARHVEEINHDPEVRVVVVRGAGDREDDIVGAGLDQERSGRDEGAEVGVGDLGRRGREGGPAAFDVGSHHR